MGESLIAYESRDATLTFSGFVNCFRMKISIIFCIYFLALAELSSIDVTTVTLLSSWHRFAAANLQQVNLGSFDRT